MGLTWVIADKLARSSRPGYGGERGSLVPVGTVDEWLATAKNAGVRSVICLLHDDQLPLYSELGVPLPRYYESKGLAVAHIPALDHQSPPLTPEHLEMIWAAYQELPKPVVVHCSAGIDRTGAAVRHIQDRLKVE